MFVRLLTTTVAAASLAACTTAAPPPEAASDAAPIPVSTETAAVGDLATMFEAGGVVRSRLTAPIASRVMAPIAEIHVRPGDRVRAGALLVSLDAREAQANRARAAAALAAADESRRAAETDTAGAEASLQLARATHERIESLFATRSATAQELDQTKAGLSAAEASLRGAQARAAAARAAHEAARASLDAADITSSYVQLTAPFAGIVTTRAADPGAMASPGLPILTLEDPSALQLEVRIDEARAPHVSVGQMVDVALGERGTSDEASLRGSVAEIARVEQASHAFTVKVDVPATAGVRPGQFGRLRFAGPTRQALSVPTSSVVRRGQLSFAFALDADSRARLRPVSIGEAAGGRVEVLTGVKAGDVVVLNPPPSLTDGARVTASRSAAVPPTGERR
jgi:multidrug efflux pump subunit AcrA (membrane-fusion protein)